MPAEFIFSIYIFKYKILKDDAEKCFTQYAANFENSTVDTGLERFSFHSNPKERQCQVVFKLPHNCTHFT